MLRQVNLIVSDMEASLRFYRELGWAMNAPTPDHAHVEFPNGTRVELDSVGFAGVWDTGYAGVTGGSAVIGMGTETRNEVDEIYARLTAAGHRGRQPPYDAFWGARYAIVEDPDGNPVGIMSPTEDSRRFWPPSEPPRADTPRR